MEMVFRAIVLGLFAGVIGYLSWSLRLPPAGIGALVFLFAVVLWIPFVFWQSDREITRPFELVLQWLAFAFIGWVSLLLATTAARDVLSLAVRMPWAATPEVLALATLLFAAGVAMAFFGVRVHEVEIGIRNLPEELEGLRIAQLSDVHVGPTIRKRTLSRIVARVERARPDLVAFTGDAVDGMPAELSPFLEPLRALKPPLGKFYVPGNHEYYWTGEGWIRKFEELGFRTLPNSHAVVRVGAQNLILAGVTDPAAPDAGGEAPDLARALAGAEGYPRILLAHRPDFAEPAEKAGFQLQLSGHTHGGQFFPWTLIIGWFHRHPQGLHQVGAMWLYVSKGTGYWGPPVRLGARPEVAVLVLKPAP